MSLALTGQELSFQRRVRTFAERHLKPIAAKIEAGEYFPEDFLRALGKNKFLGAPFSKSDGGLALGWVSETIVAEEISAVSGAAEMARLASAALYSAPLANFGNNVQKKRFLRSVLSGEKIGALALTEPQAGSDAGSIITRARHDGRDFVLNGEKRFITNGGVADYLFLFAVTDPSKPARSGLSAFVIPRNSKGLEVVRAYGLLGMRGANVAHLRLRNVRVPRENLVGVLHRGFSIILDELDRERPAVAAGMMGIARSAFEEAVRYSSTREQFGRPIRDFEGVSFKIADMAVKLAASRLLIIHAARVLDRRSPARKEGAIAKLYSTEAAFDVAHESLQVHGGLGYTKDLPIERYFRDARFMMIGGGTSEIMRYIIQREVYKEMGRLSSCYRLLLREVTRDFSRFQAVGRSTKAPLVCPLLR
ncbi:acyl-CoA dehydrogenase [Candidatus Bathyarchaeota archaeon]|nr:MAG: acyl-CoA dehydrogenase [Candidatus Bathyarchaeota archaeon]